MQDPNLINRPPEDRPIPPVDERGPTVVQQSGGGTGGWAVAVILAVLVAVGVFYFVSGTPGDGVDPNANTSAIGTQDTAPAGGATTDGTQTPDVLPGDTTQQQPAGGGATTTTP